jgi:hypothetical protein
VLGPFDDLQDYANCSDVPAESGDKDEEDKSVADDASILTKMSNLNWVSKNQIAKNPNAVGD